MKLNKHIFLLLFCLSVSFVQAQKGKVRQATKNYDNFAYIKTSDVLLKVAEKGYKSVDLFQKLGNSFYFNNKMKEASKWYGELVALNKDVDPEYYFRYAQALKYIENYEEADKWMRKFNEVKSDDSRGKAFISKVDYLSEIEGNSNLDIELYNLNINTEYSDFGTTQYKDKIIFASSRGGGEIYKWNEQPYLDLYSAKKEGDSTFVDVLNFGDVVNTKYHESTATFTSDNQRIYFTRNNYYKGKYRKDKNRTNRLKLYSAKLQVDGTWGEISSIHFNNNNYSVAHPTINIYGTKLYFASDMPGTIGLSDLYVADVNEDGSLGEPTNLGAKINTEGQETFPYVNSKGDLFFSSNAFPGLGGLDVYVIRDFEIKYQSHQPYIIENLGRPINSAQDDFGYYENLGTKEGFITSNRPNGKGDDDIYAFTIPKCEQEVSGIVKDKKTLAILPESTVILFDKNGTELQRMVVGTDAAFTFSLACEKEYLVRAEKQTYTPDEKRFTTPRLKQELQLELLLEPDEQVIEPCSDLAKILNIPIIYFDFDKYYIRSDAAIELQKVLVVLNQYPSMSIDIRSHTDCRGTYKYNETLSDNRAKSTRQYLIDNGIAANRLTAKGYGEYQLINDCACEGQQSVYCSDAAHQLNRRSEFLVTSFKGVNCNED